MRIPVDHLVYATPDLERGMAEIERLTGFFVDWGESPHPAGPAAPGSTLAASRVVHPDVVGARRMLRALGLEVPVTRAERAASVAVIDGRRGRVELR